VRTISSASSVINSSRGVQGVGGPVLPRQVGLAQAQARLQVLGGDQHLGHGPGFRRGGHRHRLLVRRPHGAHHQRQADGGDQGDAHDDDSGGLHQALRGGDASRVSYR
jgi:hypothetical protein